MIRVPIDPPGPRRKLDVEKGIWVGRLDESDGHVVLTPHGTVTGRPVRRLAGNRVRPDLVERSKVVFEIQLCLRPNFWRYYLRLCPSDWQVKLIPLNCPKNKTELHREHMDGIVDDRARAER